MITLQQFIDRKNEIAKVSNSYLNTEIEKYRNLAINSDDKAEREKAVDQIERIYYSMDRYLKSVEFERVDLEKMYDDMNSITHKLSEAFECEWLNDTDFAVKTNHESLSGFAWMLAGWFGITSTSGFTFGSCFTTHNGITKNGLYVDITCTADEERYLIRFKGLEPKYPFWVSEKFVKAKTLS